MAFIFLDESGQFIKSKNENYFILATFTTSDQKRTAKAFRTYQRNHFPRKMSRQSELKFTNVSEKSLKLKMLSNIARSDVRIRYCFFHQKSVPTNFRDQGKVKSGSLYAHVVRETLNLYLPTADKEFRVFCDQRHLKGITQPEFKEIIRTGLLPNLPKNTLLQIEMLDSTTNTNIQIADWIAGALASYHNGKPFGEDYFKILRNNLLDKGKQLFTL